MCNRATCPLSIKGHKKLEKLQSIGEQLQVYAFGSYQKIPAAKRAWITILAKKRGKDPISVHAGIKAAFTKMGK